MEAFGAFGFRSIGRNQTEVNPSIRIHPDGPDRLCAHSQNLDGRNRKRKPGAASLEIRIDGVGQRNLKQMFVRD